MISALLAHFMNILLAIFLSLGNNTDQCVWYFINLLLDSFLGLLICYILMLILDCVAKDKNWKVKYLIFIKKNLQSGLYFETEIKPNGKKKTSLKVKMYFIQLLAWIIVVFLV